MGFSVETTRQKTKNSLLAPIRAKKALLIQFVHSQPEFLSFPTNRLISGKKKIKQIRIHRMNRMLDVSYNLVTLCV